MPYVMTKRDRDVLRLFGQSGSRLDVVPVRDEFYGLGEVAPKEYSFKAVLGISATTFVVGCIAGYLVGARKD